jgi:wobble nucleotide-excising tRNase
LDSFESLETALAEATELMMETVESVSIDRLKDNSDISEWVEQGLHIHIEHKSDKCEFCEQVLPEKRISQLSQYFNEADKKLKSAIAENVETLRSVHRSLKEVALHDQARLYSTLQEEYSAEVEKFDGDKEELLENIKHVAEQLKAKKAQTWEKIELENTVSTEDFVAGLGRINNILEKHNTNTDELETNKAEALLKVKNHHFTEIYDEVAALEKQLQTLEQQKEIIEDGDSEDDSVLWISQVKAKIAEYRATISSAHSGCENLNAMLVELLGRNEIIFEANEEEDGNVSGYSIKRGDEVAHHISDGEQAAIAFAYFCIHLNDQTFSLADGIVVIDDPVSSLDYGMLFRLCTHIEKKIIRANQLFIFTHNYDFFNHMKKWFYNSDRINNTAGRSHEEEKDERGRFLMLNSVYDSENECRTSKITDLDELLRDYESEYHYLFKKLIRFDSDNPPEEGVTMKAIYDYPNMTRKLLECYLSFRVPKRGTLYTKILGLKTKKNDITSEDIGYVYNFINSHSHLDTKSGLIQFDPTLSLNGRDSVYKALNLIELSDPEHYKAMKKATRTNTN